MNNIPPTRHGFAVILAISVMALLALLMVSIAVLLHVQTAVTDADLAEEKARQHAFYAMRMALGELQQHAGPDQRYTGTATLLDEDFGTPDIDGAVNQPFWTGIWKMPDDYDFALQDWETGYMPHPIDGKTSDSMMDKGTPAWLISGNEARLPGQEGYLEPDANLKLPTDEDSNTVYLLKNGVDVDTARDGAKARVWVPVGPVNEGTRTVGNYAYWVSDQQVKAKINTYDPFADASLADDASSAPRNSGALRERMQFRQSSLRPAVNKIEGFEALWPDLSEAAAFDTFAPLMESINRTEQLPLILSDAASAQLLQDRLQAHYHDLGTYGYSVQSNPFEGGLKRDLSLAFEMTDEAFFFDPHFAPVNAEHPDGSPRVNGLNAYRPGQDTQRFYDLRNPDLRDTRFQYVYKFPAQSTSSVYFTDNDETGIYGPVWHQFRNYYRTYKPESSVDGDHYGITVTDGIPTVKARVVGVHATPETDPEHWSRIQGDSANNYASSYYRTAVSPYANFVNATYRNPLDYPENALNVLRSEVSPIRPVLLGVTHTLSLTRDASPLGGTNNVRLGVIGDLNAVVWNPYNVRLEVDAIEIYWRPDSGENLIIETEIPTWRASNDYKLLEEVIYSNEIWRKVDMTTVGDPPAPGGGWLRLDETIPERTVDGKAWTLQTVIPMANIYRQKDLRAYIYSEDTIASMGSGIAVNPATVVPLVLEPGEIRVFSPARTEVVDIGDAGDVHSRFLAGGDWQPRGGSYFDQIRAYTNDPNEAPTPTPPLPGDPEPDPPEDSPDGTQHGKQMSDDDAYIDIEPNQAVRVTLTPWGHDGGSPWGSSNLNLNDVYSLGPGNTSNNWRAVETGNDGVSVGMSIGFRGDWNRNYYSWNNNPAARVSFHAAGVHTGFEFRSSWFRWWYISEPGLDQPPQVYIDAADQIPLLTAGVNKLPLYAMDYYTKSAADRWKMRTLVHANIMYTSNQNFYPNDVQGYDNTMPHWQVRMRSISSLLTGPFETDADYRGYWGLSSSSLGSTNVSLFEVPTAPLTSLGQFQHVPIDPFGRSPTYPIANSLASAYVPLEHAIHLMDNNKHIIDQSHLINRGLFDGYFFSTLTPEYDAVGGSQTRTLEDVIETTIKSPGEYQLPNPRMVPWIPQDMERDEVVDRLNPDTLPDPADTETPRPYDWAAAHMMYDGGFNVNSTSVEAWKAFLGSTDGIDIPVGEPGQTLGTASAVANPFPRVRRPAGQPMTNTSGSEDSDANWRGFRSLTDEQITLLAENMVEEVKRRGPFTSVSDFVNRRLHSAASPAGQNAMKGAIQAAIDNTALTGGYLDSHLGESVTRNLLNSAQGNKGFLNDRAMFSVPGKSSEAPASTFSPGSISQADILQALAPAITVRSDTFVIRTYGDVQNPTTGEVISRQYLEAVVQRTPEYVDTTDLPTERPYTKDPDTYTFTKNPDLSEINHRFGRQFEVVLVRWLGENEI